MGEAKQAGWQPIETAPKDGTDLLLFVPARWADPEYVITGSFDGGLWSDNARGSLWGFEPSHWMYPPAPPGTTRAPADLRSALEAEKYLVWSNEHRAWWGKDRCGYTRVIERAGRYDRAEAMSIAGTRDGGWYVGKGNPDEIAIPERDAIEQYAAITSSQVAALAPTKGDVS